MPRVDPDQAPSWTRSDYPEPWGSAQGARVCYALGDAGGLTQFGARLTVLPPGAQSALRHWHRSEDEFAVVLSGELVLVEEDCETVMRAGDCAAFPAGVANGHHFLNRSGAEARLLAVGTRSAHEVSTYPDVDLMFEEKDGRGVYSHKDGTPYPAKGD